MTVAAVLGRVNSELERRRAADAIVRTVIAAARHLTDHNMRGAEAIAKKLWPGDTATVEIIQRAAVLPDPPRRAVGLPSWQQPRSPIC